MTNSSRLRSEVHVTNNQTTTGVPTGTVPITATIPLGTTVAQMTTPLIFGTMPPITRVIATVTDTGTHYSTVTTTTRGGTGNNDVQ